MWLIRPVAIDDTEAVFDLAASLGPGMTTFPADLDTIATKVKNAVASFSGHCQKSEAEYLMVLEDTEQGKILGVSAVYPEIGRPFGFFSYHVDKVIHHSAVSQYNMEVEVLNLSNAYTGMTEIGTLAVSPNLRGGGAGKMLARARYMLMACFPHLFSDYVIAEMRGWQNDDGSSPFWEAVGEKFFKVDFPTADKMSAVKGAEWFAALLPKNSLYLDMLPDRAKSCVGKAHETSAIAMKMLLKEGFRFENFVDIFDAGPQVIAPLKSIKTVSDSKALKLSIGRIEENALEYFVSNHELSEFRLIKTKATITGSELHLDPESQRLLGAKLGNKLRAVTI